MKKRLLSILTALTLCLTLLPTAALAEEEINTAAVTVISYSAWPEGGGEGFADSGVENLFDRNPNTSWQWRYNGSNNPTWVRFETSESISVARYTLSTGKTGGSTTSNPISWTLNASSDGKDWVQIDSVTSGGLSSESAQSSSFKVSPSFDKYKYFELRFTQCYGGRITLGEIELERSTCLHTDCEETVTLPTCTKGGSTYRECKICHATQTTDFKPALGHNFGEDGACTRAGCTAKRSDFQAVLKTASDLQYYTSVHDALNAAQSKPNSTVRLLTDIKSDTSFTITSGSFTLDLAGCELTVANGAALDIKGSTTNVTICNSANTQPATMEATGNYAKAVRVDGGAHVELGSATGGIILFTARSSAAVELVGEVPAAELRDGTLTIFSGEFTGKSAGVYVVFSGSSTATPPTLVVHGGKFSATEATGSGLYAPNGGTIALSGGEYHKICVNVDDPFALTADGCAFSAKSDDSGVIDRTNPSDALDGTVYVVPHTHNFKTNAKCACGLSCPHTNINESTGICNDCSQQVGSVKLTKGSTVTFYSSLPDAVTEAAKVENAGSTVALLTDIDLHDSVLDITNPNCDFIIDLNGKTLKTTRTLFNLLFYNQTLTIINTANTQAKIAAAKAFDIGHVSSVVNVGKESGYSNIRFDLTETFVKYAEGYHVNAPMTVNIYGGEYNCTGDYALNVSVPYAVANIIGGEFTGKAGGIYAAGEAKLAASGGKFLTSDTESGYGLIVDGNDAQVALSGGEYQGIQTDTRELSGLLAGGYGFKKADNCWLSTEELTCFNIKGTVTVKEAAISSLTVKINDEEVADNSYVGVIGKAFSLSAVTVPDGNVDVKWFQLSEGTKKELTESTFTPVSAAPTILRCEVQKDGYTIFKDITVTADAAVGIVTQPTDVSVTYGDTALPDGLTKLKTEFESGNTVSAQWFVQSSDTKPDIALTESKDLTSQVAYGEAAFSHTLNAGSYRVYCKLTITSGSITSTVTSDVVTLTVQQKTLEAKDLEYTGSTTKVYDGTISAPVEAKVSVRSSALVGGDTLNVTGTIVYDTKNITATKLTFTPDAIESRNYRLAADEVLTVSAGITPKMLTGFDFSGIAVKKIYDGTTGAGTLTGTVGFNGKVNTDDVSIKAIPGVYADEKVGQNKHVTLTLSLEGTDSENYTLAKENKTYEFTAASITKADGSVTAPKQIDGLRYNGEAQTLVTGGSSTTGEIRYRLGKSGTYGTALPQAKDAGSYTLYYKVVGDSNHKDVEEKFVTVEIKAAELTVTAKDKNAYIGGIAPDLSKPELNKDYVVDGLIGEDHLIKAPTLSYDPVTPDMTKIGEAAKIIANGADAGSNYSIIYVDGTLSISRRPSSGGSTTTKAETTTNPDGSTTKTETKSDGTVVETTTRTDGSTTRTETKTDGSSVTESKTANGSTGTVKTVAGGKTEAEAKISTKAVEDAKKADEAVKVPTEVKAGENSNSAPTVKVELPKNAGETKIEIPVENVNSGTVAVIVHEDGTEEIVKDTIPTEDGVQLTVDGNTTVKIIDNSKDFIDTKDHWAKDAIDFVSARELVNGVSSTLYAPDASTTRAQLWTILARQNDADLAGGTTWYEKAQAWSVASGISDGTNPNGTITRAQMVTMLWRAAGSPEAQIASNFTDVAADSYYAQAVAWAVEHGITTGTGNGKFSPNDTCTRAQIAAFLMRSYQGK